MGQLLNSTGRTAEEAVFNIWRSDFHDGLEVVTSSMHDDIYPPHLHDALEIIVLLDGAGTLEWRGGTEVYRAGEAAVVPPNELHGGGSAPVFAFQAVHIPRSMLEESDIAGPLTGLPFEILSESEVSRVVADLPRALRCAASAQEEFYIAKDMIRRLRSRRTSALPSEPSHPAVDLVQAIIRVRYAGRLAVGELARRVNLDQRYLISIFKLATGMPPGQFQIAMRVDLARRLIEAGNALSDVAALAGFSDQSHLNRHFKRQYGMTPGTFRRRTCLRP